MSKTLVPKPKTTLVIFRTDKLGDLIISTPVIAAVKAQQPDTKIMVVVSPYNAAVLQGHSQIDDIVLYDKKMSMAQKGSVLKRIRAFAPTHTLVLSPKNDCFMLSLFSGANQRGGLIMEYRLLSRFLAPLLLTHKNFISRGRRGKHQTARILDLAQHMGIAAQGTFPYNIGRDDDAVARMRTARAAQHINGPSILVHLADKWLEENWTPEDVMAFLKKLHDETKHAIITTAGPADHILSAALKNYFPCFSHLSFHEWAALMEDSALIITPDCGAIHLACALQKPLLALYPPSRFEIAMAEFGPWGTVYCADALLPPALITPVLLTKSKNLLGLP